MTSGEQTGEELVFPSSAQQKAFWYLQMLEPATSAFNVPFRFLLEGSLNVERLRAAFARVIDRHEVLRTRFEEGTDGLSQVVVPSLDLHLPVIDLRSLPAGEREKEAERLAAIDASRPFDLSVCPLLRAGLVRTGDTRHHLHFTAHHTVFDGWSLKVLVHELASVYAAMAEGREPDLPVPELQYGDYSVWQREHLEGPEADRQLDFWKRRLEGVAEVELPTDRPRPAVKQWEGGIAAHRLPVDLSAKLKRIASENGCTAYHLLLAVFKVLLLRYTGSHDIAIGTPATGRVRSELEPLIGVFINPLMLRTDLSGDPSFLEAMRRVGDTVVESLQHQELPFESVVNVINPDRDPGRNPMFQVNFTFEGGFSRATDFGGLRLTPLPSHTPGAIFDLHLFVAEDPEGWSLACDYSSDLFERTTIERMLGHFAGLLEEVAREPGTPLSRLSLFAGDERSRLVEDWAGEAPPVLPPRNVSEAFAEMVRLHPDRTALSCPDGDLRYSELGQRSDDIAKALVALGVGPGDQVALCLPASTDAVASILGVLRVGAAYVPINPSDPSQRIAELMSGSGAGFLIVSDRTAVPSAWTGPTLELSETGEVGGADLPPVPTDGESRAYVMFTSGSTGRPKGVAVPHRGILRLVRENDFADFGKDEVFLLAAPLSFDASVLELFGPLLNGGRLVVPEAGLTLDDIATAVESHGVTTMWLTSGLFQVMVDERLDSLRGLRQLLVGGDVLSKGHVAKAFRGLPDTRIINGYGPTENTTFTTCHTIRREDFERASIPIGRPIKGTTVYILDAEGGTVPVGIPGVLHTGGQGLANEYVGDAELTASRFREHPEFGRLYNTGDRCRWLEDGTIEFLGRVDHQVKLRGFRIEPGEIESVLGEHPQVTRCKVAVRGSGASEKRLFAWFCGARDLAENELSGWLAERLPSHMVPDAIVWAAEMPLNANGKVSVADLPVPEADAGRADEAPTGDREVRLAEIWRDLLGAEVPGRDRDFFELGGNSLSGMRMFARIQREFGISLPLATLLRARTIRLLAAELAESADSDEAVVEIAEVQPSGDRPPLCAVHAGDGGILFYRQLAERLPKDRPFLAIESPELGSDGRIEVPPIEETAARYIEILRATRPDGPYLLAGYSYGGVVAFEMARQLVEAGAEVPFVGLFDTINPATEIRPYALGERVATYWNAHSEAALGERIMRLAGRFRSGVETHLRAKAESAAARNHGDSAAAHTELRAIQLREAHEAAMDAYQPGVFHGTLHVFRASAVNDKFEVPDDYGWGDRVDRLEMIEVPGEHLTMFEDGNVGPLADAFDRSVRMSTGGVSPGRG